MLIPVSCPCGAKLKAPDTAAGKTVACPKCKARLTVPECEAAEMSQGSSSSLAPCPSPAGIMTTAYSW
jgi:hypothetical protein